MQRKVIEQTNEQRARLAFGQAINSMEMNNQSENSLQEVIRKTIKRVYGVGWLHGQFSAFRRTENLGLRVIQIGKVRFQIVYWQESPVP